MSQRHLQVHCQSTHEPTLNPKLCQRACKSSTSTAFYGGLGFTHAQKQNKFVLRG